MYLLKQQTGSLGGNIVGGRRNLARSQFRGQTLRGGNTCCVNTLDPVASAEIQFGKYKQIHKHPNIQIKTIQMYKYKKSRANTSRQQHLLCQDARPNCQRRNSNWKSKKKYTNIQIYKSINIQMYKYMNIQICKYTNIQIYKYIHANKV